MGSIVRTLKFIQREKVIIGILNDIIEGDMDIIEGVRFLIKNLSEIN
jgi:hypothetical protein